MQPVNQETYGRTSKHLMKTMFKGKIGLIALKECYIWKIPLKDERLLLRKIPLKG
jgi:hypothetical protein